MTAEINAKRADRAAAEREYGRCWDTSELQRDFTVVGFGAPFVVVVRKADNVKGSMKFQHGPPRLYFQFSAA